MLLSDAPVQVLVMVCYEPREECQVFFGAGDSQEDAVADAISWAVEAFSVSAINLDIKEDVHILHGAETIPAEVASSMKAILAYDWPKEEADYVEQEGWGHDVDDHVFTHMKRVDGWLDSV